MKNSERNFLERTKSILNAKWKKSKANVNQTSEKSLNKQKRPKPICKMKISNSSHTHKNASKNGKTTVKIFIPS